MITTVGKELIRTERVDYNTGEIKSRIKSESIVHKTSFGISAAMLIGIEVSKDIIEK